MIAPVVSVLFVVASLFEGQGPKHVQPTAVPSPSVTASAPAAEPDSSAEPSQAPETPAEPADIAAPSVRAAPRKPAARIRKPAPPPGDDRSAASKEPNLDNLLGDKWTCTTFAGTKLQHRFTESEDGRQLTVVTTVALPHRRSVKLIERYAFDSRTGMWSVNIANGALNASAPQWTGKTWRFTGSSVTSGTAQKAQMTFEPAGASGFRREFSHLDRGHWAMYSGETCRRSLQI